MVRVHPCLPAFAQCRRAELRLAAERCRRLGNANAPNEPGHRHASRWIESHCASRHARARRRRSDLAAPRQRRARRHRRRQAGRPVVSARHDASVRIVTDRQSEALPLVRHSTAHLLAAAVTNLFPGAQCGIGPATDEGFFYDFVVERPFVPEDLDAIEQKMRELAVADLVYERQMWPREEAKAFFAKRGEPLKVQLIDEKTEGQSRSLLLHDQGQGNLHRLLRRPARAVHRQAEGVQAADARRTRTGRATRATSRCSASTAPRSSRTRS